MLAVVFMLCLLRVGIAYELKCSEKNVASATMRPSEDGIPGRYKTQVCVEKKPNVIEWGLDLTFKAEKYCINKHHGFHPGKPHSMFKGNVSNLMEELNCTYVCLETQWDLIFSSCYFLKSTLRKSSTELPPYDSHFNITNPYTYQYFNVTAEMTVFAHEHEKDYIEQIVNFFGRQPPTEYSVELYNTNKSLPHQVVTENCSIAADAIRLECSVRAEEGATCCG
ncbi:uncharacterized protein LOC119190516 [Manduca sexta]|uniref:uncharacterized protein LOC115449733 n=1 Tax=Manduca sexta TaxID=7130 RepID=UPI00188E6E78|nr:uncharacterized protein LOC115449733 [Manduca sexta]XP_037298471.1 uncharacterized protein LOC119190516 [Manduca sexta]